MSAPTGVLLLTFGSAVTADDVEPYLRSVRGGGPVAGDTLQEFRRRYTVIGRSPLIDITREQADALQAWLDGESAGAFCVQAGMLHSAPRIGAAVDALAAAGVRDVIAVVLAPQYSPLILAGYERAIAEEAEKHQGLRFRLARSWHTVPEWLDSLTQRLQEARDALPHDERDRIPVIFTAHSLPRAVVERDPAYIAQLHETARAVAERARLGSSRWQFAYQSAGHTAEEWLTPDVKDLLPGLRDQGHSAVLIVPVQFLADHLEILYDIDVAAAEEAASLGMAMWRIAMPNTSPALIRALAAVVRREVATAAAR